MTHDPTPANEPADREVELARIALDEKRLEKKSELSSQGLRSGSVAMGLVSMGFLFIFVVSSYSTHTGEPAFFTGWQVVAVNGILVSGLCVYFALVFRREIKLAGEFSKDGVNVSAATGGGKEE